MNVGSNLLLSGGAETTASLGSADTFTAEGLDAGAAEQGFQLKLAEELDGQAAKDARQTSVPEHDLLGIQSAKSQEATLRQQIAVTAESTGTEVSAGTEESGLDLPAMPVDQSELAETVSQPTAGQTWWDIIEKARTYSSVASLMGAAVLPTEALPPEDLQPIPVADIDISVLPPDIANAPLMAAVLQNKDTAGGSAGLVADVAISAKSAADPVLAVSVATEVLAVNEDAAQQQAQEAVPALTTQAKSAAQPAVTDKPVSAKAAAERQQSAEVVAEPTQNQLAQNINAAGSTQSALSAESVASRPVDSLPTEQSATMGSAKTQPLAGSEVVSSVVNSAEGRPSERKADTSDDVLANHAPTAQQPAAEKQAASSAIAPDLAADVVANRHQSASSAQTAAPARPAQVDTVTAASELAAVTGPVAAAVTTEAAKPTSSNVAEKSDKLTASNSFAEHQKAANQQLQQQLQQQKQQSGQQSSQNPRQYAAALTSAAELSQPTTLAAGGMTFSSQLQQLTEQPAAVTGQPATPSLVTPAQTLSAALATQQTGKAAELQLPQTPLMLAEPHAAQQIKDRVMVQIQHKLQTAEVQLHPEDLGAMQIKLNLQQDQLSVQFVVQQGAAKEALEQQMPKLRDLLEQQGIALADSEIEERSSQQQERGQGHSGRGGQLAEEQVAERAVQISVSDRMVDYYA